jgi:quinol monooxygenase YgiN
VTSPDPTCLRREVLIAGAALAVAGGSRAAAAEARAMYGLIGSMTATLGQRAALTDILVRGVAGMPGCVSYVVAHDLTDPDLLWVTEVWESREAHVASLSLPSVRDAIARGRPLIAKMAGVAETRPVNAR